MATPPQDRLGGRFAGCRGDARCCVPSEEPKNEKVPVQFVQGLHLSKQLSDPCIMVH